MKYSSATHEICISPAPGRKTYDWARLENGSMIPRRFIAELVVNDLRISLEIEADAGGHSQCLRVMRIEPDHPGGIVASIPSIPALLRAATAYAGSVMVFERSFDGGWEGQEATASEASATINKQLATNPARRADAAPTGSAREQLLQEVAATYRAVSTEHDSGIVEAVADRLLKSRSATYELVKSAREAGLLEDCRGAA